MSELEDRVNSILNDPSQMEKITKLAQSLMGGNSPPDTDGRGGAPGGLEGMASALLGGEGLDPAAIDRISRLLSAGREKDKEQTALLEAMKPYLSEKRRGKMDRAMKLAKLARIARAAMGETGENSDV